MDGRAGRLRTVVALAPPLCSGPDSTMPFVSRIAVLALGCLALAAAPGCKNKNYPSCKKDKDCVKKEGEKCVDGLCQNCKTDADCVKKAKAGETLTCQKFTCLPPGTQGAGAGMKEEGEPCTAREECLGGLACKPGADGKSICTLCTEDADCSPSTCTVESGRCSPVNSCTTDEQCAMDEICDGGMCIFSGDLGNEDGGPCGLAAVFFAFDSDVLTPKTQEDLKGVAQCIAQQNKLVYLEAHADNRGTEEYNILLTERRGTSVRNFLKDQGVVNENMQVVAKGSLEAVGTDEATRSKERRVQFIWP
jgi:peptidoglycan-associated lipoprotein